MLYNVKNLAKTLKLKGGKGSWVKKVVGLRDLNSRMWPVVGYSVRTNGRMDLLERGVYIFADKSGKKKKVKVTYVLMYLHDDISGKTIQKLKLDEDENYEELVPTLEVMQRHGLFDCLCTTPYQDIEKKLAAVIKEISLEGEELGESD